MGVWSKGNDDFKIRHGITCTSCYFPESVFYRAMGRSILSLHYILLMEGARMAIERMGKKTFSLAQRA